MRDLLAAQIQAYEIQGILALHNSFNRRGLDHVILVRIASAGVAARMLGGTAEQVLAALSHAFLDGGALRTYRHGATTGSRKSWAAGDATSRGLWLALLALRGEMGYPAALSAPDWGFQDVVLGGAELRLDQPLGCYVAEDILFKVGFPAEFHGQTAVEAALDLHPEVAPRAEQVAEIVIHTQEPARRIIDKQAAVTTPLPATTACSTWWRWRCCTASCAATLPRRGRRRPTHRLPARAHSIREDPRYSAAYLDPARAPSATVSRCGSGTARRPARWRWTTRSATRGAGQRRSRPWAAKLARSAAARFAPPRAAAIRRLWDDAGHLDRLRARQLIDPLRPLARLVRGPLAPWPDAPAVGTRISRMPPARNSTAMLSTPMLESPVSWQTRPPAPAPRWPRTCRRCCRNRRTPATSWPESAPRRTSATAPGWPPCELATSIEIAQNTGTRAGSGSRGITNATTVITV